MSAGGQQPPREPRDAVGNGTQGMAVRLQRSGRQTRQRRDEPGAVGQAQRA